MSATAWRKRLKERKWEKAMPFGIQWPAGKPVTQQISNNMARQEVRE